MLHIILTILKITGILLLALILLVIGLIAAVLFVPLRYRLLVIHNEQDTHGEARVTWLFHLVTVQLLLRSPVANDSGPPSKALQVSFRILGISPQKVAAFFKNKKKHSARQRSTDSVKAGNNNRERKSASAQKKQTGKSTKSASAQKKQTGKSTKSSSIENKPTNESPKTSPAQRPPAKEDTKRVTTQKQPDSEEPLPHSRQEKRSLYHQLKEFFTAVLNKIRSFGSTIRKIPIRLQRLMNSALKAVQKPGELVQKLSDFRQKLERYDAADTVKEVWYQICHVLRHFRVRKGKGYLRFGTGDPALTGELTGILYLVLPVSCREITVEPQFTDTLLETELEIAGHIRLIHLASLALWAFRNQKLRRLIRAFRK